MDTEMRTGFPKILGVAAIATFTVQMAIAAPHSTRKPGRVSSTTAHQFRDAFGSAHTVADSKSCDIIWCYQN
jgi:hypothetical protein